MSVASESEVRYDSMCHWFSPWDQTVSGPFTPTWIRACHH